MEGITRQLDRIEKKDQDRPRKKITILGAGMAGLAAAYELKNLGHDVQVFEASNRVGGRVWTKRFDSGQYHEFGAMRIPKSHDYTHHYVQELKLKLRPFVTSHQEKDCWYDIRGVVTRIENAQENLLPHFKLSEAERAEISGPDCVIPALFGFAVSNELRALSDEARTALFGTSLPFGVLADLDCKSLGDLLKERLSGPDAMELIGATTGLEVWWDRCLTMFLRDEIVGTGAPLEEIVGGMDLLPEKLAKKVHGSRIHLNSPVRAIRATDDGVSLSIEQNGNITHHSADFVLCTIPFSVLRHMQLDGISLAKRKAIRNLSYASATKVLLHCKTRFWETGPDPILGGASLSDQISRATYYPSDHFKGALPEQQFSGLHTAFATERITDKHPEEDPGPGVLVGSYAWGQDARRLGALSKPDRARVVAECVSRFHPELAGFRPGEDHPIIDDYDSISWDEQAWAGGAFSFLQPGDHPTYYRDAIGPEGRLYFAGEHCSLDQAWIQGALISSLRAVEEMVAVDA